ncbi:MAG: hypothetical protein IJT56_02795, partial [Clostridia bacterium]|nr:hypothetical protein [Clostridia bacterium]
KMTTETISFEIPVGIRQYISDNSPVLRNALLIYPAVMDERISRGRAAELLGISKYDLIDIYNSMKLPQPEISEEDIADDVNTLRSLLGESMT